nr:chitobiase/beta-hexosaminidase C-terminal domain-containing protein [Bacteroidaceae bacterium]
VTLSAADGAAIHYTTDGSVPTSESQTYSAPFMLSSTTVVKAIAIKNGVSSDVASKTFTKSSSNDD